jgi:hypothetical protein
METRFSRQILSTRTVTTAEGDSIEVSIHECRSGYIRELDKIFPGVSLQNLLVIPTMQRTKEALVKVGEAVESEKDRCLEAFMSFAQSVCAEIASTSTSTSASVAGDGAEARAGEKDSAEKGEENAKSAEALSITNISLGANRDSNPSANGSGSNSASTSAVYFADYIDPCSGLAMITRDANKVFSEVDSAQQLLGYSVHNCGCCKVLLHPVWGSAVYPASIFTTAPLEVVLHILQKY